jgi:hypothetical protein
MTKTSSFGGPTHSRITQASLILFKIVCTACYHVALLTPAALLTLGIGPAARVLDRKARVRYRGCGAGEAAISVKWARQNG